jgi:hypothetical protein
METLTPIERAVLGTTADAPENLEQIYQLLNSLPAAVPLSEAADAVWSLVERGLLATQPPGDEPLPDVPRRVWKARFEPTPQGRELINEGGPKPPSGWPEGRVYFGMFKGMIPEISAEEIDEARREMWGNFPRDFPE